MDRALRYTIDHIIRTYPESIKTRKVVEAVEAFYHPSLPEGSELRDILDDFARDLKVLGVDPIKLEPPISNNNYMQFRNKAVAKASAYYLSSQQDVVEQAIRQTAEDIKKIVSEHTIHDWEANVINREIEKYLGQKQEGKI